MPPFNRKTGRDGRTSNRPPSKYQFKPGQSGNRKGRPKKTPTVLDIVEDEFNSTHSMNVGNQQIRVPMKRLLIKQLLRFAMKGNTKALFLALEMLDTIQKKNAKRYTESLQPRITKEDLKNKTEEELTALYFEALKVLNHDDDA
jgi:hypothetical protein